MKDKDALEKINYTSRDFDSIKKDLVQYARRYYPEVYRDFNEASFGSLMLDTVSYVGDILSFYLDYQANESFLETATEPKNVLMHARSLNYRHDYSQTSMGLLTFYILVPAQSVGGGPDISYVPVLRAGSLFSTSQGVTMILTEDVNFADPANDVVVGAIDNNTKNALTYAIKARGTAVTGILKSKQISVGDFKRFLTLDITDSNNQISEIISVTDSKGNEYFEVDHLSQDIVYKSVIDRSMNAISATATRMRRIPVPRRFVLERKNARTFLQFGHGSETEINNKQIQDPSSVVLKMYGKDYVTDKSFDPTNLINNDKMGISPANTVLTVVYRASSPLNSNLPSNSVTRIVDPVFDFKNAANVNLADIKFVQTSIQVSNESPIIGADTRMSIKEIKTRAKETYASQNRAVTKEDYINLCYRMPKQFGSVRKAALIQDFDSLKRNLNLYVLSTAADGSLSLADPIVKDNLKRWLLGYKMVNDTIDILDGEIINFGVEFSVIGDFKFNKYELLERCIFALRTHFSQFYDFGEPLYISEIYKVLNSVRGVVDTKNVTLLPRYGGIYSDHFYDFSKSTVDGRYVVIPNNMIFEIKNFNTDLVGGIQ